MSSSRSPVLRVTEEQPVRAPVASWYAQGPSDGFGDRLLMFDNASTGPLELLRVRPDFSLVFGFEGALLARFDRLSNFSHRSFAPIRVIKHLEEAEGLSIVSAHVAGTRLSELFQPARPVRGMHPASVRAVFGELISAVAELHRQGLGIAHGALAPERVVMTSERHLVVTDYVFGDALQRLKLSAERLWNEFGVVAPSISDIAPLDQRGDVIQLGLLMLSLVVGRRISPSEYSSDLSALLREFSNACDRRAPDATVPLRTWLEQALDPAGFKSAVDAERAIAVPRSLPAVDDIPQARPAVVRALAPAPAAAAAPAAPLTAAPPAPPPAKPASTQAATSFVTPASTATPTSSTTPSSIASTRSSETTASSPTPMPERRIAPPPDRKIAPPPDRKIAALPERKIAPPPEPRISTSPEPKLAASSAAAPSLAAQSIAPPSDQSVPTQTANRPPSPVRESPPPIAPWPVASPIAAPIAPEPVMSVALRAPATAATWPDLMLNAQPEPVPSSPIVITYPLNPRPASPAAADGPARNAGRRKPRKDDKSEEPRKPQLSRQIMPWVAAALLILVLAQGGIIARLMFRPTSTSAQEPQPAAASPAPLSSVTPPGVPAAKAVDVPVRAVTRSASAAVSGSVVAGAGASRSSSGSGYPVAATSGAAVRERTGTIRVISPIPVDVVSGEDVLGSSGSGPLVTTAGVHDLEFVNSALAFRTRQTVRVNADRTVQVRIDPPKGAMSVNAQPWAQVWIDGQPAGDTPLANLPVTLGEHEVIFRHPQYGERRQRTVVQAGTLTRVSVVFTP
jgi:hypothetical protein